MARKLPWLMDGKQKETAKNGKARKPTETEEDGGAQSGSKSKTKTIKDREGSSSPAPEPLPQIFMNEGFDKDDIFIMVEDEFEAVARDFTTHLHHAAHRELERLHRDAAQQGRMLRPIDPRAKMSRPARKAKEGKEREIRQKAALRDMGIRDAEIQDSDRSTDKVDGSEKEDDEDLWVRTSLRGLMESPRKARATLESFRKSESCNRSFKSTPAIDSKRAQRAQRPSSPTIGGHSMYGSTSYTSHTADDDADEETEDDDNLDGPPSLPSSMPPPTQDSFSTSSFRPPSGHTNIDFSIGSSSLSSATPSRYLLSSQQSSHADQSSRNISRSVPRSTPSHFLDTQKSLAQLSPPKKNIAPSAKLRRETTDDIEADLFAPTKLPYKSRTKKPKGETPKVKDRSGPKDSKRASLRSLDEIPIFLA